ncbi:hypothetical protein C0J52_28154 [Blattella germanica]|nr:hypothetical protein C0J52_28154 [Blattella germanica]
MDINTSFGTNFIFKLVWISYNTVNILYVFSDPSRPCSHRCGCCPLPLLFRLLRFRILRRICPPLCLFWSWLWIRLLWTLRGYDGCNIFSGWHRITYT